MVQVPRSPERRIQEAALPEIPVTQRLPLDVSQVRQVTGEAQRFAADVARITQEEEEKVLRRDFLEQKNAYDRFMIATQNQMRFKKGRDARHSTAEAEFALIEFNHNRLKALEGRDPRLAEAVGRYFESLRTDLQRFGAEHEFTQDQEFTENVQRAFRVNLLERAAANAGDIRKIREIIDEGIIETMEHGRDTGKPMEWFRAQTTEIESAVHLEVLKSLLSEGRDLDARDYLEDNKANMVADHRNAIQGSMREGSIRGEAQRQSDAILVETDDLRTALDKVRQIKDVDVRRLAENNVKSWFADRELIERTEVNDIYEKAARLIDENPGVSARQVIDPNEWVRLDARTRSMLEDRALDRVTDVVKWNEFRNALIDNPQEVARLTRVEFDNQYWQFFSRSDQRLADQMWASLKQPPDAQKLLNTEATQRQIEDDTMALAGIDPSPGEKDEEGRARVAQYRMAVRDRIRSFQALQERQATEEDVTRIARDVLTKKVMIDRSWIKGDIEVRAALVLEDERESAYVPIDQIPATDLEEIRNKFRSSRVRPTDDKIQRYYAALLIEDDDLAQRILFEEE